MGCLLEIAKKKREMVALKTVKQSPDCKTCPPCTDFSTDDNPIVPSSWELGYESDPGVQFPKMIVADEVSYFVGCNAFFSLPHWQVANWLETVALGKAPQADKSTKHPQMHHPCPKPDNYYGVVFLFLCLFVIEFVFFYCVLVACHQGCM